VAMSGTCLCYVISLLEGVRQTGSREMPTRGRRLEVLILTWAEKNYSFCLGLS
jgi:hypothetical protein